MKHSPKYWLLFLFLIVFSLTACSTSSMLLPVSDSRIINHGSSFGQSFTSINNGLSAVSVLLAPDQTKGEGSLLFHLKTSIQSTEDLARARLPLSEITHQAYYRFDFSPQSDSQRKDYYVEVDVEDQGQIQILTAPADSYLDGALYENQIPQEAQLGFRLEYDRKAYILGLLKLAIEWVGVLLVGLFVFILPGWALFDLLWHGWNDLNWVSKLGLSGGLSLAIYPVLLLWTNLIGLHLGLFYAWFPPTILLLATGWKNRKIFTHTRRLFIQRIDFHRFKNQLSIEIIAADIAFVIILGMVIVSRLWVIRFLDVPLFGDSYQHTMITQLIIDHGGLFNSWEPYADLTTFTYHFGFHSSAAVFHWITGASAERAVLWTGQLINILAILGLYPIAYKITKNRWAGVLAILIGGLLSFMPMYYVNWGRYTQLAGQVVLIPAIYCSWSILERSFPDLLNIPWSYKMTTWRYQSLDIRSLAVVWLALGGVALTHYRILILVILFFPAYGILAFSRKEFLALLARIGWIGIGGLLLFFPWFIHVFGGKILEIFAIQITTLPTVTSISGELFNGVGSLQTYLPILIWILFLVCIGWGLWKRKKDVAIFTLWWFIIILATNPNWIGLPGMGVITNFAILIALYIPASVIIGSVIGWIVRSDHQMEALGSNIKKSKIPAIGLSSLMLIIVCALGIWGLSKRVRDINTPTYALVTRPDLRAMEWIRANTTQDDRFLINSFSAYENSSIVGSDAGWWLPLLALRQTTVPPLTYAAEQGITPDYRQKVNALNYQIENKGISDSATLELLKEEGINYIYIGQRQGRVNYSGSQIIDPQVLLKDQHFQLIYHQDRVWLFIIRYAN